jgi:hypothetical protein
MTRARYLISFPSSAMDHLPEEEMPAVAVAAHTMVQQAKDAGVFIFSGGLDEDVQSVIVSADGTVAAGAYPETAGLTGGFTVIDVPSRDAAVEWAARFATACRCPQELRSFGFDPLV